MKALLFLLPAILVMGCSDTSAPVPPTPGHLVVYVYYDGTGLEGRTLEIVETGATQTTDENGLAEFDLPPGRYVLRAYGITMPGPGLPYIDQEIEVLPGEDHRVEVFDCLPCV